jgi:tRNA nucleotidyltransferase (CCA-adding enzyme)
MITGLGFCAIIGANMEIGDSPNISKLLKEILPPELVEFFQTTGEVASGMGFRVYLVGGAVRDLFLRRTNMDVDLAVEGDAVELAKELALLKGAELISSSQFGTAKVRWRTWIADLATARSETYAAPGALPCVKPGDIANDLVRRDFTINAMAIRLEPGGFGDLLDKFHGQQDLENKLIRILHGNSFVDDATRIWRAVRYEQRLGFSIESETLNLLRRDVPFLGTISGDRIRREIELALEEDAPEKIIVRAAELGILKMISSSVTVDAWLAEKFREARQLSRLQPPPFGLYLALLTYRMEIEGLKQLISYLKPSKSITQSLLNTASLKAQLPELNNPGLAAGRVYRLLHIFSRAAVEANLIACDSAAVKKHIDLYLTKLHCIQPELTGGDLIRIGARPGPDIGRVLETLREARMDGWITSRHEEIKVARKMLGKSYSEEEAT